MRDPKQSPARRTMLAGAGTLGALAAAATLLPKGQSAPATATPAESAGDGQAGYRLTEHVQRYYQTTRI